MKRTELFQTKGCFRTAGAVLGLLLFMACSKDPIEEIAIPGERTIRFAVTESDKPWQTRSSDTDGTPEVQVLKMQGATPADTLFLHATVTPGIEPVSGQDTPGDGALQTRVAEITAGNMTSFGLLATLYPNPDSQWNAGENEFMPTYIYNANVQKDQGWTLSSYRWPVGQRLRLCAYSPNVNSNNITLSDKSKTGNPTLTYIIPSTLANQRDLVVAVSDVGVTEQTDTVGLNFQHVLTGIQLTAAADIPSGKIKRVFFTEIHNKSTLTMGLNNITWGPTSVAEGTWNYEKSFGDGLAVGGGEAVHVLMGETRMMMMPQTLPADAKMNIVYADNATGVEQVLTASLSGSSWVQGTTVTYNLSLSSSAGTPVFTVTPSADTVSYDGGTIDISLTSQRTVSVGSVSNTVNLPWTVKATYSEGDREVPCPWVTFSQNSGDGGTQTITMTVKPQKGLFAPGTASRQLQDADSLAGTTDLSMIDGVRTTANCYLVHQAGRYLFPLIYGNAKKKGQDNVSAYKFQGTSDGTHYLMTLKNYLDKDITSPRIWEDCGENNLGRAVVLWSDAPDVVTNPTIGKAQDGAWAIVFDVTKETIRQANAVIALLDTSNRIMWSWHIWVTPYNVDGSSDIDVTTPDNHTFHMMGKNLGWRDQESGSFDPRQVKVTFTQSNGTQIITSKEFTVTQNRKDYSVPFSTPYYQWGRKDPLHPASSDANATPVYTYNNYQFTTESTATYVSNAITHPMTMFLGYSNKGSWSTTPRYNLWDSANGVATFDGYKKVVKTIYDPCPRGYCVPPVSAFKFTKYLDSSYNDVINYYGSKPGESGSGEWIFYTSTKNQTAGKTIRVPLMGYRDPASNGSLYQFKEYCTYWTAHSSDSETYGWAADFDTYGSTSKFQPATQASKNWACTIRPIREE